MIVIAQGVDKAVKKILRKTGCSRSLLARKLGVDKGTVKRWEESVDSVKTQLAFIEKLEREYCSVFDVSKGDTPIKRLI